MNGATKTSISAYELGPAPDVDEFTIGATDPVDVSSIGGYPVRRVVAIASGTVVYQTTASDPVTKNPVNKTATLTAGDARGEIGMAQITAIRGTGAGSSAIKIRVYK